MSLAFFHARPVGFWLGMGWLLLVLSAGLLAPWLPLAFLPAVPDLQHVAEAPSWAASPAHWLGTDTQGRDVLTELVYGARQVVSSSLPAALLATLVGALAGGAAGFWGNKGLRLPWAVWLAGVAVGWWALALPGRWPCSLALAGGAGLAWWRRRSRTAKPTGWPLPLDAMFQSALTLLSAVPRLVLVLVFAAGPALGTPQLVVLLVLVAWPEAASQVRTQMLRVRELPFVEAARAAGLPTWRVWYRHALPHACRPLLATAPLSLAGLIGLESTLAFLGVGRPPDVPSWGNLLGTLQQEPGAWWLLASAGGALVLTLLALQQLAQQFGQRA
ncbi:ABC transporter permease [Hymenobacter sp. BT559]|uniref:ABC transporter permease n=1 Tax=Hymenobacter sp. BT559 TaxID=2795729 RepID=UPI0018EDD4A3|nr:ABC transporter permease subunit [Hymenobacter sp. BT559]MBJ6143353.1 ABC transporter permease [Hymenobacter sp. BT559]